MTATLSEVRVALAGTVANLPGLLQVHVTVPDKISPPCAIIQPAPGDFLRFRPTFDDVVDYLMLVSIYVPGAVGVVADSQELLDLYLAPSGTHSVYAVINADSTLGGLVSSVTCNYARNYRAEMWDEARHIGVDFPVGVMT
jgi:hypothetical protein